MIRHFDLDPTQETLILALMIVALPATRLRPFLALRGQTSVRARRQRVRMGLVLGISPALALVLAGALVPRLWFLEPVGLVLVLASSSAIQRY